MWKPGDTAVLRGVYNQHVWIAQSTVVVKNDGDEVALAMLPGAECVMPEGYINGKHGVRGKWDRWEDYAKDHRDLQKFAWHTNRLLVLMEPKKYYATIYFWENASNQFLCYYVNFQLPFQRSEIGFDTLDLELDIVIEPTYEWHWKDEDDFQRGMECGILRAEWIQAIEAAKPEIFGKLENRYYPFNDFWLGWLPDPGWSPPTLPENWDKI